ncbi:MAG TPA: TonB-dependent receptor [Aggregicoccus sp.]|nr:TonB-dependent receptor [Aggregicoccus sp.]
MRARFTSDAAFPLQVVLTLALMASGVVAAQEASTAADPEAVAPRTDATVPHAQPAAASAAPPLSLAPAAPDAASLPPEQPLAAAGLAPPSPERPSAAAEVAPPPAAAVTGLSTTVTATRGRPLGSSPVASHALLAREVAGTPARAADTLLSSLPGVVLPRAEGRAQHTTTQSVQMRGVGRGRTLVLVDGLPVNDPFGGWIQWNRVPRSQVDRVEVVRGATSNLYGGLAMGGVIQYFTRPPRVPKLVFEADYGAAHSAHLALYAARPVSETLSVSASADTYRSDGHYLVSRGLRGTVDERGAFASHNVGGRLSWHPSERSSAWVSTAYFQEERSAGTALTRQRQWIGDVAAGAELHLGDTGRLTLTAYGSSQKFHNRNSRVDEARESEVLALRQTIPVQSAGGSAQWTQELGRAGELSLGLDLRETRAENEELPYAATGALLGERSAGGRQRGAGLFGEWSLSPLSAWTLFVGARLDSWQNFQGHAVALGGEQTLHPDATDFALSPRLGSVLRLSPSLALRGAAYTGFRAPNLNELYRGFFSGRVQVIPNPALGPERLRGAEAGVDWQAAAPLRLGATAFVNRLMDRIEQVTLDATTRQRRNIAEARSEGVELEAWLRLQRWLSLGAAYTLTQARIRRFPDAPELEGKQLSGVPRHTGMLTGRWSRPGLLDATVRLRAESEQYADELNGFSLPAFAVVDVSLSRRVHEHLELYASASNLLDAEVMTERNASLERVGAPRTVWAGFRVLLEGE